MITIPAKDPKEAALKVQREAHAMGLQYSYVLTVPDGSAILAGPYFTTLLFVPSYRYPPAAMLN